MKRGAIYGIITLLVFLLVGVNYWISNSMPQGGAAGPDQSGKQMDSSVAKAVEEGEKKIGAATGAEPGHEGHEHGPGAGEAATGHEGHDHGGQPEATPAMKSGMPPGAQDKPMTMGNPNAKVKVEAFLVTNVECHQKTVDLLNKVAKSDPDRVYIEVYELHSPAAAPKLSEKGVTCASVFIDGKTQYTINRDGKQAGIDMSKKPNEESSTYNSEDVPVVIDQQLKAAYGKGLKTVPKG